MREAERSSKAVRQDAAAKGVRLDATGKVLSARCSSCGREWRMQIKAKSERQNAAAKSVRARCRN